MANRRQVLRAAALATVTAAAGATTASVPRERSSDVPVGARPPRGSVWQPHFVDRFDTLDTDVWYRYDNDYGHAMQVEDRLRPHNVTADGTLRITTRRERDRGKEFTSGFVSTGRRGAHADPAPEGDTFFPRAGFYELRGKVQHGQGIQHAWWLRHRAGASTAEVDVLESFHATEPGRTRQTLHLDGTVNTFQASAPIESPTADPDWHTWGVGIVADGTDVQFTFYTDGRVTGRHVAVRPAFWHDHPEPDLWDLSINTHTGGVWAGHPDDPPGYSRYRGGFCLSESDGGDGCVSDGRRRPTFPAVFEVDYVKVWRLRRVVP